MTLHERVIFFQYKTNKINKNRTVEFFNNYLVAHAHPFLYMFSFPTNKFSMFPRAQ
jgi:hypothetical protein